MSATGAVSTVLTLIWQGTIALAAAVDMLMTGLPAAVFTVAWLATCAGPIVPSRQRWSNARQLSAMLLAGGGGMAIGLALAAWAPTPRLAAECMSFGVMSVVVAMIASLPVAFRFALEDSATAAAAAAATT